MRLERTVSVDGVEYPIVISDEPRALLAAQAAGRVFAGLWNEEVYLPAEYVIGAEAASDRSCLERIVRRFLNLPWIIGEGDRVLLREFTVQDAAYVSQESSGAERPSDEVFYTEKLLRAYLEKQYRFYEYGLWAIVRKQDGKIVGKAGIVDTMILADGREALEIGYHIFEPWRRNGYAKEACELILPYIENEYGCPVCARTKRENIASRKLLEYLGFVLKDEAPVCIYGWKM